MSYLYPYGDTQQLNLAWFLAKFRELYEYVMQLDPGGTGADVTAILSRFTEKYDSNRTYIPGDYTIYDGYIYKANTTTGGTFDSSAWDAALPVNDVQGLRILLGGLSTDLDTLKQNAVTNTQYTPGAATADGLLRQTKNGTAETVMTVDKEPTANSQNPVKSGAVYSELDELKGSLNTILPFDTTPTSGSTKGVTSGGVFAALPMADWFDIPLSYAESEGGTRKAVMSVYGNIVIIAFVTAVRKHAEDDIILTVPVGYRPSVVYEFLCGEGNYMLHLQLKTNGDLVVYLPSDHQNGSRAYGTIMFYTTRSA